MFRDTFVTASWKLIERITRPAVQQNCVKDAMHVINVRLISITEKQYFELTVWSSIGKWKSARKLLRPDPFLIHTHERVVFTKCQISCCRCSFGHNATSESYALCLSSMASTGKAQRFLMFFPHCHVHARPTRNSGTELTFAMCCVPLETATEPYSEAVNSKFWILGIYSDNAL